MEQKWVYLCGPDTYKMKVESGWLYMINKITIGTQVPPVIIFVPANNKEVDWDVVGG